MLGGCVTRIQTKNTKTLQPHSNTRGLHSHWFTTNPYFTNPARLTRGLDKNSKYTNYTIYKESKITLGGCPLYKKLHSQTILILRLVLYGQLGTAKLFASTLDKCLRSLDCVIQVFLFENLSGCRCPQHQSWFSTTHIRHCSVGSNHKFLRQQLSNGICLMEDVQHSTNPLWLWPRRKKSLVQANKRRPA